MYTAKSVFKYYTLPNSPTYTCFLDVSEAFDKIHHWALFRSLIDRKTPIVIVNILQFCFSMQSVCIMWESFNIDSFKISCGFGQGGILSSKLSSVYVDNLHVHV